MLSGVFNLSYHDVVTGTDLDLADLAFMNDLLDVQRENERRINEELVRRAQRS